MPSLFCLLSTLVVLAAGDHRLSQLKLATDAPSASISIEISETVAPKEDLIVVTDLPTPAATTTTAAPLAAIVAAPHPTRTYGSHPFAPHAHTHPAPACAEATDKSYCLEDEHYPLHEIERAAKKHVHKLLAMYADIADLSDATSVDRSEKPSHVDATTLCPADVAFIRPLRAANTQGKWRIVINDVQVGYEKLTQTTRVEECTTAGQACPLVPKCLGTSCLQKSAYHRYLIYDAYDPYFPFAIESFELPASCGCHIEEYILSH